MHEDVRIKLERWGNYMRHDAGANLGYPTSSIEHRMKQGCFGSQGAVASDDLPDDIELTELAVLQLPHDLQAVITVAYTTGGNRDDQARRVGMRLGCRISRHKLNRMLDTSHSRLAGFFDALPFIKKMKNYC